MHTFGQMMERGHERVCFHHDEETGLRAIIAIHSTRLGSALGGTRRWHYATEEEALFDVLRLSEGMSYKAACANLPMGGAKSVILTPEPNSPRTEAEARAMGRFIDTFSGDYIAAEDVGIDTQFIDWMSTETDHAMGGETVSTGGDPSPFTAKGTFNGMKACLRFQGKDPDFHGLRVAVQGLGHVGMDLCRILHTAGAELTVADINQSRRGVWRSGRGDQVDSPVRMRHPGTMCARRRHRPGRDTPPPRESRLRGLQQHPCGSVAGCRCTDGEGRTLCARFRSECRWADLARGALAWHEPRRARSAK